MKYDIKPGIRGLIFDLDGTLADSMPLHFKAWQRTLEKYNATIDSSFLRAHMGTPGWSIAEELIRVNNIEGKVTVEQILEGKLKEFIKVQHLVPPVEPVVAIARKYHGKLPMAVGTGGHREAVERTLTVIGMRDYFEIVVTANDVTSHKPHPETFLKCAELMGVAPEYIEVFEDGDLGIEAALRAGMVPTDVRSWYDSNW
ncbi:MAG: HAD-IA family hydrolase [Bacteroidales bacterium]|nr:HAD-IA family hydrolase [Bacteroidales bacterium]